MNKKKEIRKKFKDDVFKRDKYTCKICSLKYHQDEAELYLDAHHITDRSEMPNGGYVPENGISLCDWFEGCHIKAELYHITEGKEWTQGMHPDDLYKLIGSSKDIAYQKSLEL